MRRRSFDEEFGDVLRVCAESMRSGLSFDQALATVATSAPPQVRQELQSVLASIQAGQPRSQAFSELAARRDSDNLRYLATGIAMNDQAGGNLAEILQTIAEGIRERTHLEQELHTATSQARASSYLLGSLPIALVVIINLLVPGYYQPVWTSRIGLIILSAGIALCLSGFGVLQLIVKRAVA